MVFVLSISFFRAFPSHMRESSKALRPHPPLTRSPFSEHGEGFYVRGPQIEVPPGRKPCGIRIRGGLMRCAREEKVLNFIHRDLKIVQSFLRGRWFYRRVLFVWPALFNSHSMKQ
jgi:hypothetical protein